MNAFVFIILQIFVATQVVLKIEEYLSDIPQFYVGHTQARDALD